jgi:hypothetical protein
MKKRTIVKPSGQIGVVRLTEGFGANPATAEYLDVYLPPAKPDVENYFAQRFVAAFNSQNPLGGNVRIHDIVQPHESGLDFGITCERASILELAEIAPLSEEFGRSCQRTGSYDAYEMSRWICQNVILKKQGKLNYQTLCSTTFLLLYTTFWQFLPSDNVLMAITSTLQRKGTPFAGIFFLRAGGDGDDALNAVHKLWPSDANRLRHPRILKEQPSIVTNSDPRGTTAGSG